MTCAELLRSDAKAAINGGGMYYSGEYLSRIAAVVEGLEAENEMLRELADAVKEFVEDTHCEDCPFRRDCYDNNRIFCANDFSYHSFAAMRELGIEVKDDAG